VVLAALTSLLSQAGVGKVIKGDILSFSFVFSKLLPFAFFINVLFDLAVLPTSIIQ
jgi:hypothetical protein